MYNNPLYGGRSKAVGGGRGTPATTPVRNQQQALPAAAKRPTNYASPFSKHGQSTIAGAARCNIATDRITNCGTSRSSCRGCPCPRLDWFWSPAPTVRGGKGAARKTTRAAKNTHSRASRVRASRQLDRRPRLARSLKEEPAQNNPTNTFRPPETCRYIPTQSDLWPSAQARTSCLWPFRMPTRCT